jgi:hypothetical protein
VTSQGYYKDHDLPSVISYRREFEDARAGSIELLEVDSEAEVGTSVLSSARALTTAKRALRTKQGRAAIVKSFEKDFPAGGFVSNVQVGKPRSLRVGEDSFDMLITVRIIGLRTDVHIAAFRIERVIGVLITGGSLGERVPLATMTRLAGIMAARMTMQLAPRNSALPTITGSAVSGQTLTATTGTWTGEPTSFAYQWQRCDAAGVTCASIVGATGPSYAVVDADVGTTLRVGITARNAAGSATAVSDPSSIIAAAGAPMNTSLPTISGTAQVGQTLTAGTGSWTGSPASFGFHWQRCNSSGTGCIDVPGATSGTLALTSADLGATIRVVVTATNGLGAGSATSPPTAVVT